MRLHLARIAGALALAASLSLAAPIKGEAYKHLVEAPFEFMRNPDGGRFLPDEQGPGVLFKIRYHLLRYFGEPVEMYRPYYRLSGKLVLRGRDGVTIRFERGYGGQPRYEEMPDSKSGGRIRVPKNIYDKLRIVRYEGRLTLSGDGGTQGRIELNDAGLLDRNEKWGVDFPGSPAWSKVFLGQDAAQAQATFEGFKKSYGYPTSKLDITEITVDLVDFRHLISKYLPRAFYPLMPRPLDRQARALMDAVISELRASRSGTISAKLKRRRDITDKYFAHYSDRISSDLLQEWKEVKEALHLAAQIEKKIKEVASDVSGSKVTAGQVQFAQQLLETGAIRRGLVPDASLKALRRIESSLERGAEKGTLGRIASSEPGATSNPHDPANYERVKRAQTRCHWQSLQAETKGNQVRFQIRANPGQTNRGVLSFNEKVLDTSLSINDSDWKTFDLELDPGFNVIEYMPEQHFKHISAAGLWRIVNRSGGSVESTSIIRAFWSEFDPRSGKKGRMDAAIWRHRKGDKALLFVILAPYKK